MGMLRHELPDQHVLDHRIVASYAPIAPLVTMSCRLLLRRVASCGVLPRERFRSLGKIGSERQAVKAAFFASKTFDAGDKAEMTGQRSEDGLIHN